MSDKKSDKKDAQEVKKQSYTQRLIDHLKSSKLLTPQVEASIKQFASEEQVRMEKKKAAEANTFTWGKYKGKNNTFSIVDIRDLSDADPEIKERE